MLTKRILALLLAAVMLFAVVSCGDAGNSNETTGAESQTESDEMTTEKKTENTTDNITENNSESESVTDEVTDADTVVPAKDSIVILANDEVYTWWSDYHFKKTNSKPYYRHEDIYYPNGVTFSWEANEKAAYYRLFLSTDEKFAEDKTESYLINGASLTLSHLYTGTKYYWYVVATELLEGAEVNTISVENRSFTTAPSPRCLEIEGVSNTRDIGGLAAVEGYRVKQGMIYRGGKLEDMTQVGKDYFTNYLGIKTDLDLRTTGEGGAGTVSPLGEDVKYVNLDGRYYIGNKGISNDEGKKIFADEVRLFADPDNYPIYIHCSLGRDRTGTLAFVIEALLGVKRNELMMDYELSVFSVTGTSDNASVSAIRSNIQATYDYINSSYSGKSFAERTENYLLDIGITPEEIQAIRDLLLEEVQ